MNLLWIKCFTGGHELALCGHKKTIYVQPVSINDMWLQTAAEGKTADFTHIYVTFRQHLMGRHEYVALQDTMRSKTADQRQPATNLLECLKHAGSISLFFLLSQTDLISMWGLYLCWFHLHFNWGFCPNFILWTLKSETAETVSGQSFDFSAPG